MYTAANYRRYVNLTEVPFNLRAKRVGSGEFGHPTESPTRLRHWATIILAQLISLQPYT